MKWRTCPAWCGTRRREKLLLRKPGGYADIIREEYSLRGLENPADMPEDKIHEILAAMRDLKK